MRLCYLCNEYPPGPCGGIGTLTQLLARRMAQAGHEVRVLGMYDGSYPGPDEFDDAGVHVRRLRGDTSRLRWIAARYRLFREVSLLVDRGEVDIIEAPDYLGWTAGWPRLNAPVLVRLSGTVTYFCGEIGGGSHPLTKWLERLALRRADYWCSESRYLADRTSSVFSLRRPAARVIYNPVECPADPGVLRDDRLAIFAGTLTEKKGIVTLLRAWPHVRSACPDAVLHVYGKDTSRADGSSMLEWLRSQIPPEVRASVVFKGHVPLDRLTDAFWSASIAVLPSRAEGFALTPLHAMTCGCATVIGSTSSGPELITNGLDGMLVNPRDAEELAAALVELFREPERARRLGRRAQQRVATEFCPDTVMALNEQLYRECIDDYQACRRVPGRSRVTNRSQPTTQA